MNNSVAKTFVKSAFFPAGAIRTIRVGPLRGMVFRCGPITGLSPWYSGSERPHQVIFRSFIQPGDTVIDIGANWGLHTLYMSRLVGNDGLVLSVEPFPAACADLKWHLEANKCRNVRILPVALGDGNGRAEFLPGASASTGSLTSVRSESEMSARSFPITMRTLDSLVEELDGRRRISLVKVDVEGAESKVLIGARKTLRMLRPRFVIDLHTPEQDVNVAALLIENGYELSRVTGPPILHPDKGWPEKFGVWGSILASPR